MGLDGHVVPFRLGAGLEPLGQVGLGLVGEQPRVALDLTADRIDRTAQPVGNLADRVADRHTRHDQVRSSAERYEYD